MELEAAKMIGAGLAAIALARAAVGIGLIFGNNLSYSLKTFLVESFFKGLININEKFGSLGHGIRISPYPEKKILLLYRHTGTSEPIV